MPADDQMGRMQMMKATEATVTDRALQMIAATFAQKNGDYADGERWDSNFRDSSRQVGYADYPRHACEVLIAVKQARLRALTKQGKKPANESVFDTLLDRAVYSVIALAMALEERDEDRELDEVCEVEPQSPGWLVTEEPQPPQRPNPIPPPPHPNPGGRLLDRGWVRGWRLGDTEHCGE